MRLCTPLRIRFIAEWRLSNESKHWTSAFVNNIYLSTNSHQFNGAAKKKTVAKNWTWGVAVVDDSIRIIVVCIYVIYQINSQLGICGPKMCLLHVSLVEVDILSLFYDFSADVIATDSPKIFCFFSSLLHSFAFIIFNSWISILFFPLPSYLWLVLVWYLNLIVIYKEYNAHITTWWKWIRQPPQ